MATNAPILLARAFAVAGLGFVAYQVGPGIKMGFLELNRAYAASQTINALMEGVKRADDDMARRSKVIVPDPNYRAFQG